MSKLNIGCGLDKRIGYINLDISAEANPDVVCNIEYGLPYPDDSMDEIIANNVLTQISTPIAFLLVMNELWRITKPTGVIYIRVPNAEDICAFQDPFDQRRFTVETFSYMEYHHRRYEQYGKHYGFKPFEVELLENNGYQMKFKLIPVKNEKKK